MNIYKSTGFECEKALPNSPEDLFNQSEVIYDLNGDRRTLTVIYLRYFDEYLKEQGIYDAEQTGVPFYEIAALLIIMKQKEFDDGRRLFFNDTKAFLNAFNQEDIDEALSLHRPQSA
mgnify:CR=1 FL=1